MQEEQHQKAFNNGYLIAKHEPELAARLGNGMNPDNEYFKTILSGVKEFRHEKGKQSKSIYSRDIEMDKDK